MYNSPYFYASQSNIEKINNQIQELEKMKQQIQQPLQPTNLTQNFSLTPMSGNNMKYANNIEEVQKENVLVDTPYFSRDMSIMWLKTSKNEVRTYELNEIRPLDDKDIQIQTLQQRIEELERKITNDTVFTNVNGKQNTTSASTNDDEDGETIKDDKPSGISKVYKSKAKQ